MEIDIISFTDAQLAALSAGKLQKVSAAQIKKNKLLRQLEIDLAKEKQRLIDRGILPSTIWTKRQAELVAACNVEIEEVREALLFYLQYTTSGGATVPDNVPYVVDFAYTMEERFNVVKEYYETTYTDVQLRFEAFVADTFARTYLGEYYAPLYHYFEQLAQG